MYYSTLFQKQFHTVFIQDYAVSLAVQQPAREKITDPITPLTQSVSRNVPLCSKSSVCSILLDTWAVWPLVFL